MSELPGDRLLPLLRAGDWKRRKGDQSATSSRTLAASTSSRCSNGRFRRGSIMTHTSEWLTAEADRFEVVIRRQCPKPSTADLEGSAAPVRSVHRSEQPKAWSAGRSIGCRPPLDVRGGARRAQSLIQ